MTSDIKLTSDLIFESGRVIVAKKLSVNGTIFSVYPDGSIPAKVKKNAIIWNDTDESMNVLEITGDLYILQQANLMIEGTSESLNNNVLGTVQPHPEPKLYSKIWMLLMKILLRFAPCY